jgi:hypothetical protein
MRTMIRCGLAGLFALASFGVRADSPAGAVRGAAEPLSSWTGSIPAAGAAMAAPSRGSPRVGADLVSTWTGNIPVVSPARSTPTGTEAPGRAKSLASWTGAIPTLQGSVEIHLDDAARESGSASPEPSR